MKIRFPRKVSIIFFIFLVVFLQAHKSHSSSHHQNEKPNSTTQNKESVIESHNHTQIHKNNTHSHHKDYHDTHKNHKYDKIHANNHNKKYDNVPKNSDQVKEDLKKKAMNDIKPKRQEYHHSGHYVHNNKSNTNIHNHSHSNVNSRIHGHRTVHEHGHAHAHQHGHSHGNGHSHGSKIQKGLQQNQFMKTFKQKFDDFLPNLYMKAIAGIIMLSIPSIPVFLFLFVVSKIMGSKNQGISDQWVQLMMAFSAGALLGDLFLHMMPHLLEGIN